MTDIIIYESGNGGELNLKDNGDIETTDGLFNQPYLAHFGGNLEASTTGEEIEGEERFDFWGNSFLEPKSQMNSMLEKSLNENALSSSGRNNIEKDAKTDLDSINELGNISTEVTITGNDKVRISDKISQTKVNFVWSKTSEEIIEEIII